MRRVPLFSGWAFLGLALLAVGCTALGLTPPTATPSPTMTPSVTPSPTATWTPTATMTFTPSPSPTATWTWTPSPSPTITPSPTVTPGTPIFRQGQVDLALDETFNFDDGGPDVVFHGEVELMHIGNKVYFYGPLYFWPPDIADCYNAPYDPKQNAITYADRYVGLSFCYTTNEGRVGALHIESVYTGADGREHVVFTYLTWAAFLKK